MRKTFVAVLFLLAVLACSPNADNGYAAATREYEADSLAYQKAGDSITAARFAGKVTAAQWQRFEDDQAAVQAADRDVYTDLETWQLTGSEPSTYAGRLRKLKLAQARVLALAKEVSP